MKRSSTSYRVEGMEISLMDTSLVWPQVMLFDNVSNELSIK